MKLSDDRDQRTVVNRLPKATYRLQLRSDFPFGSVAKVLEYLKCIGVSDLYLSPLFAARRDSSHGYDVIDHSKIEPAFGNIDGFRDLSTEAQQTGMGILLDIVPNHMGINDPNNTYWNDVLENGPKAQFSHFFDIDWDPPTGGVPGKVLLPCLGRPFGEALDAGELKLEYTEYILKLHYFDRTLPIAPSSWHVVLNKVKEQLPTNISSDTRDEFLSVVNHFERLPHENDTDAYYREQGIAKRRLARLAIEHKEVLEAIKQTMTGINGSKNVAKSFASLEELLLKQHYRLAFWQVAYDEINYRRFFDINDLAAIRVENLDVFNHVHQLTFDLLKEGLITGLRIDHPDGLLDPGNYFRQLQSAYKKTDKSSDKELYVVVEKILSGDEPLPDSWRVSGTTGYELLNQISGVLVDIDGVRRLQEEYSQRLGMTGADAIYEGKKTILANAMASELSVLASRLFRIARSDRSSYDFTLPVLMNALTEFIACFSVYRTYTKPNEWEVGSVDQGKIREAIRLAKIKNPTKPWSAFDYLAKVLLLEFDPSLSAEKKNEWRQLALKVQQVTGPVTAKGIEDTAFYRYFPLLSLNEVGAELEGCGLSTDQFHRIMERRSREWPRALSATATHDTKRGEDVRARLHVLSELPSFYAGNFTQWDAHVRTLMSSDVADIPCENERYLIYQTLIGTWPVDWCNESGPSLVDTKSAKWTEYSDRMQTYFQKAIREAKVNTSWRCPMEKHEVKFHEFVDQVLKDSSAREDITNLVLQIAGAGYINSVTQLVLKTTLPGIPDFYQGTEFWDFHLVDPDNRRPVDYMARSNTLRYLLDQCGKDFDGLVQGVSSTWKDELKMLITLRCLAARSKHWDIFSSGMYVPISVSGRFDKHVLSFARVFQGRSVIVTVPRLPYALVNTPSGKVTFLKDFCGDIWDDTAITLNPEFGKEFKEVATPKKESYSGGKFFLRDLMNPMCFSILASVS